MTAQELADALVRAASVPGGVVLEIQHGVWRATSPYSSRCVGHGAELGIAVLSFLAQRDWDDATTASVLAAAEARVSKAAEDASEPESGPLPRALR